LTVAVVTIGATDLLLFGISYGMWKCCKAPDPDPEDVMRDEVIPDADNHMI